MPTKINLRASDDRAVSKANDLITATDIDGKRAMDVYSRIGAALPSTFIFKFLKDTAASSDMAINATSTAAHHFDYTSTVDSVHIVRVNMAILDVAMAPSKFGGLTALTNGLKFSVIDATGTELFDFTDGEPIKNNVSFGYLAGVDTIIDAGAAGDSLNVRWTIQRAGAALKLGTNQIFRASVQDDLSGLDQFQIMVQGLSRSD
jgi:hypothetical protein